MLRFNFERCIFIFCSKSPYRINGKSPNFERGEFLRHTKVDRILPEWIATEASGLNRFFHVFAWYFIIYLNDINDIVGNRGIKYELNPDLMRIN